MNKTRKLKKNKTSKNKFGGKINCQNKCKQKFFKEIKKSKKLKNYKKFFSYFGFSSSKFDKMVDEETKKILNQKENTDDPVFKICVSDCEKSRK
jgi:hypothetical protein